MNESGAEAIKKATASKKRKSVSQAERLAVDLSKLAPKHFYASTVNIQNKQISFPKSSRHVFADACNWKEDKLCPRYCRKAEFNFEANLSDRKVLTRYSVTCASCFGESCSAVHLYCAHCDDILTGSIAGPGGKTTDHLVTIKHVYLEAKAVNTYLEERGSALPIMLHCSTQLQQVSEYVNKLDDWSETIRYPRKSLKKSDFKELIDALRDRLPKVSCSLRLPSDSLHLPSQADLSSTLISTESPSLSPFVLCALNLRFFSSCPENIGAR
jgi:hypothetical protein